MPELPKNQVLLGDCREVLKTLPENALDCIVSDPPYGLGTKQPSPEDIKRYLQGGTLDTGGDFMGKDWEMPPISVWKQCLRVLKPGGHLLAFAGTRTFDVMSAGIKAAGFEDTDTVASMFGPSVLQWVYGAGFPKSLDIAKAIDKMKGPGSEEAKKWQGWGTALKPAWEPVLCFRKSTEVPTTLVSEPESSFFYTAKASRTDRNEGLDSAEKGGYQEGTAYLVLREDLSEEEREKVEEDFIKGTSYEEIPETLTDRDVPGPLRKYFRQARKGDRGNIHVTVKPVALMRWLIRLVCPVGGTVLDPYAGSGTTLVAAAEEGMDFIGIEIDPVYHTIASKRAASRATARDTKKTEGSIFELAMGLED